MRDQSFASRTIRVLACSALATAFAATPSLAQCPEEPPIQTWTGAGSTVCPCFVAGEEAGAVFNAPPSHYPLEILRVQIGWGSVFGGSPQQLERAIKIYEGGLPNPGAPIFNLPGPVLSDGFLNEFDLELIPGNKIINSGPFTVTLEFDNNSTILTPSVVHDGNGCTAGANVVKAIPGGWSDACALGVTGDWLFSVVYRPLSCCNDTAFWFNYGTGFPGTNGIPTIVSDVDPILGSTVTVRLDNSLGGATVGFLFVGLSSLNAPAAWGGNLLVNPTWILRIPVPAGGASLPGDIPLDPALCGVSVFVQAIEIDPGAAAGLSSTPGLELHLGN